MKKYKLKSMIQYDNNIHIFLKNHPAILSHNKIKNHFLSSSFLIKQLAISNAFTRLFAKVIWDLYRCGFSLASSVFIVSLKPVY